jgi:hypothetical protein
MFNVRQKTASIAFKRRMTDHCAEITSLSTQRNTRPIPAAAAVIASHSRFYPCPVRMQAVFFSLIFLTRQRSIDNVMSKRSRNKLADGDKRGHNLARSQRFHPCMLFYKRTVLSYHCWKLRTGSDLNVSCQSSERQVKSRIHTVIHLISTPCSCMTALKLYHSHTLFVYGTC